jgi:hypothetical protein
MIENKKPRLGRLGPRQDEEVSWKAKLSTPALMLILMGQNVRRFYRII